MYILDLSKKLMYEFIMITLKISMAKPNFFDASNKLVTGKMKGDTGGVAIEEFVGLKPKMYPFLLGDNKKQKAKRHE